MQGKGQELRLGSYILMERLGQGGMGEVFKARHEESGQLVALKVLRPKLLNNDVAVLRFQREYKVIAQLDHPNIVHFIDADVDDGRHYFAMEFVQGTDLAKLSKDNGPLIVRQACEYVRQAAMALQHAHERGMVHRDIKPANILVMPSIDAERNFEDEFNKQQVEKWGLVKVLDMGLARIISQDRDAATTLLTQLNVVMGTPDFISPEQALNSHDCDIRSDIYSLGCTLYFLLTGKPPFPSGNVTEKLICHRMETAEPVEEVRRRELIARGANPDELKYLSSKVGKLVRKLMAKKPEERPQTPIELAHSLSTVLDGSTGNAVRRPIKRVADSARQRQKLVSAAPTKVDTTGPVKAIPVFAPAPASMPAWPRKISLPLLIGIGGFLFFAIALVALVAMLNRGGGRNTPVAPLPKTAKATWRQLEKQLLEPPGNVVRLWDDLVAFRAKYPNSAEAKSIAKWFLKLPSPLAHLQRDGIPTKKQFAWQPPEHVAVLQNAKSNPRDRALVVAFSPSAHYFAAGWENTGVVIWKSEALPHPENPVPDLKGTVKQLAFSPDGHHLAIGMQDGRIALCDPSKQTPRLLQKQGNPAVAALAFTSDSQYLLSVEISGETRRWEVTSGAKPKQLLPPESVGVEAAAFSPNGKFVARCLDSHLQIRSLETKYRQSVKLKGVPSALAFSDDSEHLVVGDSEGFVYYSTRENKGYRMPKRLDGAHSDAVRGAAFSPNNKQFATVCASGKTSGGQLAIWNAKKLSNVHKWDLRYSMNSVAYCPDGRHLAVAMNNGMIYIFRIAGDN